MADDSSIKTTDTKKRLRLVLAVVCGVVLILGGTWYYFHERASHEVAAVISGAPGDISSLPGVDTQSQMYNKSQGLENQKGATQAREEGKSFVPTITRPAFIGDPSQFGQLERPGSCPVTKTLYRPNPAVCQPENLRLAKKAGVLAMELRCQSCSCPALKLAGFTAGDLKETGYTAKELRHCGYTIKDLVAAGFSPADLKAAGYTRDALKAAGFTDGQLRAAGFLSRNKVCSPAAIEKAKAGGASATALHKEGCTAEELKRAGFTDAELAKAGFSPAEIAAANAALKRCTVSSLRKQRLAGKIDLAKLRDWGCSLKNLKSAGFSAEDLKKAGYSAGQLKAAGFSAAALRKAGFSADELRKAGFSAAALRKAGFSADALRKAGYTKGDLLRAGYSPEDSGYAELLKSEAADAAGDSRKSAKNDANALPSILGGTPEARLAQMSKLQQQEMSQQERRAMMDALQGNMLQQSQQLLQQWTSYGQQGLQQAAEKKEDGMGKGEGGSSGLEGPTVKAGSVMFAILDTSVNSDENTPILAHLVTGPLKGSKLMGKFQRVDKKLYISFYLMNVPWLEKSIAMDSVAIDPDTARTALSGEVNNHYLLRYGSLFAAAFVEGMGQSVTDAAQDSNCVNSLFCTKQNQPISTKQQVIVGLGRVGQRFSDVSQDIFNRPPTVKVESGTGFGLLFKRDLVLPAVAMGRRGMSGLKKL